jgi:hypothetical protein
MYDHYEHLRTCKQQKQNKKQSKKQLDGETLIDFVVERAKGNLLICGHSLGAAVATLFAVELSVDYPHLKIHLVTFGGPRVLSKEASLQHHYESKMITNLRFVNSGDMINILGNELTASIGSYSKQGGMALFNKFGGAQSDTTAKVEVESVSLYHFGNAVYSPNEKKEKEWYVVESTGDNSQDPSFDWANDPPTIISGVAAFGSFVKALAKTHRLDTPTGYVDFIFRSKIYQKAVDNLEPSIQKTFDKAKEKYDLTIESLNKLVFNFEEQDPISLELNELIENYSEKQLEYLTLLDRKSTRLNSSH